MDFNDYAQPKKPLPWKPIALIAGGGVLLVVGIFIVVRLAQDNRQEEVILQNGDAQVASRLQGCAGSADPDRCRVALVRNTAQSTGEGDLCDVLASQEEKDNCYWSVARSTQDVKFCASLSIEEQANRCADDVNESRALSLKDPALCGHILDASRQGRCQDAIAGPLTSENCEQRKPEVCADMGFYELAQASRVLSDCDGIVDESIRLSCYDAVEGAWVDVQEESSQDTDEDGLTSTQEDQYGTDPENPDTDGDGYMDGAEVAEGYNPNGSGKLQQ